MNGTGRGPWLRPLDAAIVLLVGAASVWGFLGFRTAPGSRAVIYLADRKYGWFDLQAAGRTLDVPTRIGTVRIGIGKGEVRIVASPCPNLRCVHTGAVRRLRGEISCAPARLLVVVEGDAPAGEDGNPDAITF